MKTYPAQQKIIVILAFTQIVSLGSLYYAFAVLASGMQRELGWSAERSGSAADPSAATGC